MLNSQLVLDSYTGEMLPLAKLGRGTLVKAIQWLWAAKTEVGTFGVVFEEANAYEDGNGPMVMFTNGRCCNIYEGDVEVVRSM